MDGFINVLKPPGMSSHDVVAWARKTFQQKKVGHTGTLDPGAAGVLVLAMGKATRLSEYVLNLQKSYRCLLRLGVTTDSGDSYGNVISTSLVRDVSNKEISLVLSHFTGEIEQIPPMTSAIKINGKKLYELARKGETVARKKRKITIFSLDFVRRSTDGEKKDFFLDVTCSKGTYIRTLCADIGSALGCGGMMQFLVRTAVGPFLLKEAFSLDELSNISSHPTQFLYPMDTALRDLPKVRLPEERITVKLQNGGTARVCREFEAGAGTEVAVYDHCDQFIAIAIIEESSSGSTILRPRKVLYL
ncbi:tRNA pseudouridine(55) synthase TruB [Metallumcola ferriviriculae]|uniref:tRNA pseudouridine synthase B n=1 Tax=Metallumcola ferriviriculae TaxID=3039180 RepID=A0AAU0ULP0_9FIRM|nr:tRNA pseudouridine(55) synthase TruB [Desulfitibacteraceae bacterium MK1]